MRSNLKLVINNPQNKIEQKQFFEKDLNQYSEILSIGSGRGITSIKSIQSIFWKRKSTTYFQKLKKDYETMVKNNYYEIQ